RCKFFPLARNCHDRSRKSARHFAGNSAFEPPYLVCIHNDTLSNFAANSRHKGHAAWRHVGDLTASLTSIGEHVASKEIAANALVLPIVGVPLADGSEVLCLDRFRQFTHGNTMRPRKLNAGKW